MVKNLTFKNKKGTAKVEIRFEDGNLSMSGEVYDEKGKGICFGQCADKIGEMFNKSNKVKEVLNVWKNWHLNNFHAGTVAQEKALEPFEKKYNHRDDWYAGACEYLKSVGLLVDHGYTYGEKWLKRDVPKKVIEQIKAW